MKKIVLIPLIVAVVAALTVASGCIFFPPTVEPTPVPTPIPTPTLPPNYPTEYPTDVVPTVYPTDYPTDYPTEYPTDYPTYTPTPTVTRTQTQIPTFTPTATPAPTKSLAEQGAELITGKWQGSKEELFVIVRVNADVTVDFKDDGTGKVTCIINGAGYENKKVSSAINYEYLGNYKFNGIVGSDSREFTCNGNMMRITINPKSIKPDLPDLANRDITCTLYRV